MPRIRWIEDVEARGELADYFARVSSTHPTGQVPPILRTMSLRPDFLSAINRAANDLHFRDGALSRAQHEMIASYVSALNRCRY
jgi:alkylhydroperoxidase/carboxymuconolactone decarboxylase family protein YurZ